MKDKIKHFLSNRKVSIALSVFVLTLFTLGYSYAAFFTVKTNKNNQTVTTGNLSVAYGGESSSITKTGMIAISDQDGLAQSESSLIYIQNNGSVNADYVMTIGYDMTNFLARGDYKETDTLTPIDYIKVAVYEYNGDSGSTLICGPLTLADLPIYDMHVDDARYNRYSILLGALGVTSNVTKTYQVKMWLSDKAPASVSNSYFYVNSEIVAKASETRMAYNLSGKVQNAAGEPIAGANISIHNNSFTATTDANGLFTINGLLPETYNLDINVNGTVVSGNITVKEGNDNSIVSMGATFNARDMSLSAVAFTFGTTINKLIKLNDDTKNVNSFVFGMGSYKLPPSYIVTGGSNTDINNIIIEINENKITNIKLT